LKSAPVEELPPAMLGNLARLVADSGKVSQLELEFLQRAQRRFPADFWINSSLVLAMKSQEPPRLEEAIGFARAAVALRPQSAGAHTNLGAALHSKGDLDGAIAAYREAIRLKQDCATAHSNLGGALIDKGLLDEAIAECRQALRLNKDRDMAHNNLGVALSAK